MSFKQSRLNNDYRWIEGKKHVGKAISRQDLDSEAEDSNAKTLLISINKFVVAFFMFCNPYSVIGRVSSIFFKYEAHSFLCIYNYK